KDAGAETKDLVRKRKLAFHLQRCIADVHTIKVGNDKQREEIRHQSPHDPAASAISDGRIRLHSQGEGQRVVVALSFRSCFSCPFEQVPSVVCEISRVVKLDLLSQQLFDFTAGKARVTIHDHFFYLRGDFLSNRRLRRGS